MIRPVTADNFYSTSGNRSAIRSFALRLRGFAPISASPGWTGLRVTILTVALCPHRHGCGHFDRTYPGSVSQMQSRASRWKNCLTIRSSSE